eukprot:IDg22689t1
MLAFLPRAGRSLATAYATSNIAALLSIAHRPSVSAKYVCLSMHSRPTKSVRSLLIQSDILLCQHLFTTPLLLQPEYNDEERSPVVLQTAHSPPVGHPSYCLRDRLARCPRSPLSIYSLRHVSSLMNGEQRFFSGITVLISQRIENQVGHSRYTVFSKA